MICHNELIYELKKIIYRRSDNNQGICSRIVIKSTDSQGTNLVVKFLLHDGVMNMNIENEIQMHRSLSNLPNAHKHIPLYKTHFEYTIDKNLIEFCKLSSSLLDAKCTIIVMSYIDGKQFQDYLCDTQNDPPNDEKWGLICHGIDESIEFLHDNNFLHGDLNQQNLLITKSFEIYILDFEKSKYSENSIDYNREKSIINDFKNKNRQYS